MNERAAARAASCEPDWPPWRLWFGREDSSELEPQVRLAGSLVIVPPRRMLYFNVRTDGEGAHMWFCRESHGWRTRRRIRRVLRTIYVVRAAWRWAGGL